MEASFVTGTVKWFDATKGYGFAVFEGRDVFIHSKRLRESGFIAKDPMLISLDPGEKLKFRIQDGPKGPFAVEIGRV